LSYTGDTNQWRFWITHLVSMTDNVPTFGCQRSQFGLSGVRQRERPLKWQQGKLKSFYRVFVHDGFFIIIVCCHCNKIRPNTYPLAMEGKWKEKKEKKNVLHDLVWFKRKCYKTKYEVIKNLTCGKRCPVSNHYKYKNISN